MITWSTFIFTQGLMVDPIQVVEILQKDPSLYMHLFEMVDESLQNGQKECHTRFLSA